MENRCLKFLHKQKNTPKTGVIAKYLGIPNSTATDLVQRMKRMGLVRYEKYRGVALTDKGKSAAEELLRNHRLLEFMFAREFDLSAREACAQSEVMEANLSRRMANLICKKYEHPEKCPCGNEVYRDTSCCPGGEA